MSVLDSLLAVLGEEDPAGGTGLAFALSSLLINPSDIRPRAGDLTTAGSAKGSPIGRLYGRLAELGQSAGRPGKFAAIMALNGCLEAGGCTPAALEAFQRQWLGIVTTCLTARAAQGVPRALACSCYSHILRGVHAAGRDTHVGREVMASLTSSIPRCCVHAVCRPRNCIAVIVPHCFLSLLRVIEEDWDGPSPRASLSAALECFITLLIYRCVMFTESLSVDHL